MKSIDASTLLSRSRNQMPRVGITILLTLLLQGCGGGSGGDAPDTDQLKGITVNDVRTQQGTLGCLVVVTATNTTGTLKGVNLNYQAFNSVGQYVGFVITQGYFIGPNSTLTTRTDTTGNYFVGPDGATPLRDCSAIASIRLDLAGSVITP
jgi:hypothetical protein